MTVDILISYNDGRPKEYETELIPICGRRPFTLYWDPIIDDLNLPLLHQGSTGMVEIVPCIDDFLSELQTFRDRVQQLLDEQSERVYPEMVVKCDHLIKEIKECEEALDHIESINMGG